MKESRQKIIVVIGTTSVGKSKLGIELAKYLKSEVISADSMQVYKGLDILTNKVTEKEMEGIPHHLISIIDPIKDDQFDVNQFNEFCRKKIVEISEKGCIPIIVGGTIYYVESLLWENTIETKEKEVLNEEMVEMYKDFSNEDLHIKLSEIDEEMSKKYHPNQRRKVLRSLQIYHQSNQKQSEIIHNQSSECRYDALIFWLGCETNHLCQRIKGRTNTMIETGGLNELLSLNEQLVSLGYESYYQSKGGLLQSIGFKEFEEYLEYIKTNKSEEDEQKEKMILTDCVEKLNQHTIKYAKKQILWIKNRMVTRDVPIYYLDTSFLDKWDSNVSVVSKEIVDAFVRDSEYPHKNLIVQRVEKSTSDGKVFKCEFCNKKIWGEDQINKHLTSKSHKKRKSSVLKKRNITK